MNYYDTMSEVDEMRAWEEGRLQGLKDIEKLTWHDNSELLLRSVIRKLVIEQQELLDEIYGEDEDE